MHELLGKLKRKDEQTERIIFEMFYQRIYNIAFFMVKDRDLAQDVVQETFFKAFKQLDTLKDGSKIESWLASIASRTAVDLLRKMNKWNDMAVDDAFLEKTVSKNRNESSVETIVEQRFLKAHLLQKISDMRPEYKQVIVLKYMYDLKDEEIANALHITVGAVKSRLHRAKLKLKDSLERQASEQGGDVCEAISEVRS